MMFCGKCGCRLSDEAAFCPNCGAPVASKQRSGANALSGSEPPVRQAPANTASAGNVGQYSFGNAAPPVFNGALQANGAAGGQKFALDKKRAVRDVFSHALFWAFVCPAGVYLALFVFLRALSEGPIGSFTTRDILFLIVFYIGIGIICALLSIIPETIVVIRRFKDPNDPAYKMGAAPDKEKEKHFKRKYTRFRNFCAGIIAFLALVFACCLVYYMSEPLLALFGDPDLPRTAGSPSSAASSEAEPKEPAGNHLVLATTWFVEKDSPYESAVILEPSGDCAYFLDPATGPGVYYYGYYAINGDKLDVCFYSSETETDFPETNISFAMSSDSLICNDGGIIGLVEGMVFERREAAPDAVQSRAPVYAEAPYAIGWTIQEARVSLDEFFAAASIDPGKIEYKEAVIANGRYFYVFQARNFNMENARPAVDAGSGEVFALHVNDGSELSNAYISLSKWLENGAQGFDHWGNGAAGQPGAEPAVHTLTETEIAALWQKMDGVWLIADDAGLTNQGYMFSRLYDGTLGFSYIIIASDGIFSSCINEVTEQNGVYQLMAYEERIGGSRVEEYEPDVREVITLILWEEDHAIEVSGSIPERYGHNFLYESGEFDVQGVHYRSLTAEEEKLLRNSPDGRVELANGDFLTEGYVSEPILCYYAGSIEDAYSYLYG